MQFMQAIMQLIVVKQKENLFTSELEQWRNARNCPQLSAADCWRSVSGVGSSAWSTHGNHSLYRVLGGVRGMVE